MRTKFITTVALAVLLTGGSTVVAVAEPASSQPVTFTCRAPAPNESGYGSRKLSLEECQQTSITVQHRGTSWVKSHS